MNLCFGWCLKSLVPNGAASLSSCCIWSSKLSGFGLFLSLVQEYFYGLANDLSPHSNIANFSDLSIYRIGGGPQAPRSALPIGAEPTADPTRLVPVNINRDLLHLVLAVSYAKEPEQIISRYRQIAL